MKTTATFRMMAGAIALFVLAAACGAADYHVNTAQGLQTALTLAAAGTESNNIYLDNGYYEGNFDYNSTNVTSLTLLAEPGVSNTQITIDSGGAGSSLNMSVPAASNITVQGMTFLRDCGNTGIGGLQISAGDTAILIKGCIFLSPSSSSGAGLELNSSGNAIVTNCTAAGNPSGGGGVGISINAGNITVQNCTMITNSGGGTGGGLDASGDVVVVSNSKLLSS